MNSYVGGSVGGLTGFFTGLMKGTKAAPTIRIGADVRLNHLGVGAGARVFWLLDRPSTIPLGVGKTLSAERNGPIRFENVRFTYPSRKEVEVLRGATFTVERGESVALVYVAACGVIKLISFSGSSGSGKTSVEQLISRFYDPNEGRITFDGTGKSG